MRRLPARTPPRRAAVGLLTQAGTEPMADESRWDPGRQPLSIGYPRPAGRNTV